MTMIIKLKPKMCRQLNLIYLLKTRKSWGKRRRSSSKKWKRDFRMKKILIRRQPKNTLNSGLLLQTLMAMVQLMNKSSLNSSKNWTSHNHCLSTKSKVSLKVMTLIKRNHSTNSSLLYASMQCLDFSRMISQRKKMTMKSDHTYQVK